MHEPLILASASLARKNLLGAAGLQVDVQPARVDEEAIKRVFKRDWRPAADCALALAEAKARQVAESHPSVLVCGADQILVCTTVGLTNPPILLTPVLSFRFCAAGPTSLSLPLVSFWTRLRFGIQPYRRSSPCGAST